MTTSLDIDIVSVGVSVYVEMPGLELGIPGRMGPKGADSTVPGPKGDPSTVPGPPGQGVAAGGSTGQVLTKSSGVDYATSWGTPFAGLNGATGLWIGTQAAYDAIGSKSPTTLYVIT